MGCDLTQLDPFTLGLLTNDEVLAIDQDALCKAPICLDDSSPQKVYIKDLEDGSKAVGLFNTGDRRSNSISLIALISIQLGGRHLKWDPVGEVFPGYPKTNKLLSRVSA